MQSKAATVEQYLAELPPDRREAIQAVRKVILANLDQGFQESMGYGMMGYSVPHSLYPAGYHCDPRQPLPYAGMASQKQGMSLYLMAAYMIPEVEAKIRAGFKKAGKKLDMGKSCVRFKKATDLPLEAIGALIAEVSVERFIEVYEASRPSKK